VNTPDILPTALQFGGPSMFALRAVLASTLSPVWGVYSGYELYEHEQLAPGREEYLDSEKFQLRPRDYRTARENGTSLEPLIARLNQIRREHPALQQMKGLWFHQIGHDKLICYSRRDPVSGDTILVVCALDGEARYWGETELWMPALGLGWTDSFEVVDLLSGREFRWGQRNMVGLGPWEIAHVLWIRNAPGVDDGDDRH
jgi:starch synthase (maltosyl-transferring)